MTIPSLPPGLKAADQPLERLAANSNFSDAEKVAEVSRQFEAVLLRQILQQGRKTLISSEFNSDSSTASIYQDMVNDQLAEAISRSGTFGLARSLQTQLARQALAPGTVPQNETTNPTDVIGEHSIKFPRPK